MLLCLVPRSLRGLAGTLSAPSNGRSRSSCVRQEMTAIEEALKRHEGCNIYGWLDVARVAGNIHFAVSGRARMPLTWEPRVQGGSTMMTHWWTQLPLGALLTASLPPLVLRPFTLPLSACRCAQRRCSCR